MTIVNYNVLCSWLLVNFIRYCSTVHGICQGGKMATFAEKLKMMRHKAGWSQREVAEKIGITPRAYAAYELEGSKPRDLEKYYKLANIFNVSKNYFLDEPDFYHECTERILNGLSTTRKDADEYSPDELADFYVAELKTYILEGKLSPEKSEKIIKELMTANWFARGV